jgi:membrane protease YdiL (CAAX protease family)
MLDRESVAGLASDSRTAAERIVDLSAMQQTRAHFWLTITIASFVVGGLREELWRSGTPAAMRALWPYLFEGRDGQIAGVALIAIIFGLAHLSLGLVASTMTSILGFLLGIIIVTHRSIWPPVIAHGMFDATSFALLPSALEHARHFR